MSIFDGLANQLKQRLSVKTNQVEQKLKNDINQKAGAAASGANRFETVVFDSLPENLEQLKACKYSDLSRPEYTAALTVAALCAFPKSREDCFEMLKFLSGPRDFSPAQQNFIADRFMDGQDYVPRSFFEGATPDNDYTPSEPLTLKLYADPGAYKEENYASFLLQSGGADSKRKIQLRLKPSTGEWFFWEQFLLSGIRIPKSRDEWA